MRHIHLLALAVAAFAASTGVLATPVVPGFTVETYANVPDPMQLSFDSSGILYVGRDNSGSGGGTSEAAKIHRVGPGGSPVEEYGNDPIPDPDSVLFDAQGMVSGTPGSVLVGGRTEDHEGHITAILPDGSVSIVVGPSSVMLQPQDMAFDSTGRVIIADTSRITAVTNGVPTTLAFTPAVPMDVEVDAPDRIFVATDDGVIRIYHSDGTLLDNDFATGFAPAMDLNIALGPGGAPWGEDLYAMSNGTLFRIDSFGNPTVIGNGFESNINGLTFGPDGALYLSDFDNDRILRIVPEPSTAVLLSVVSLLALRRRHGTW